MIDTAAVARMSVKDRLDLVELIWDSIALDSDKLPVPEGQKTELERRLAAFDSNPEPCSSWKDARRRIESQL